jgi:hypothetical protein
MSMHDECPRPTIILYLLSALVTRNDKHVEKERRESSYLSGISPPT